MREQDLFSFACCCPQYNGNDPFRHVEGCDCAWFFDDAGVNIKIFVSALTIAGWTKEDS